MACSMKARQILFEIPGTSFSSSQSGFYKDYSNSDFMKGFLNIKELTSFNGAEIKLICSAAIRLNPYKGFYPAQRTLDLVSQFSRSFASGLAATGSSVYTTANPLPLPSPPARAQARWAPSPDELIDNYGASLRPLFQPLFAPGILYNSIKSGMAVDFPVVTRGGALGKLYYGATGDEDPWHWATTCLEAATVKNIDGWDGSGSFFDVRLPFETIIEPGKTLRSLDLYDMEAHPSAAVNATASLNISDADKLYSKMASNFFGEVGNFFLKGRTYTKLESGIVTDDMKFKSGSVYGARLKIRRSLTGERTYDLESGSWNQTADGEPGDDNTYRNQGYTRFGGCLWTGSAGSRAFVSGASYPLPQDPRGTDSLEETFTMYSRPSAFGPDYAGRPAGEDSNSDGVINKQPIDCFNGFNWAYTPPYYHGESWVDFIFRPVADRTYDLDTLLSEIETVYWRVDPGPAITQRLQTSPTVIDRTVHPLLPDFAGLTYDNSDDVRLRAPYLARCVNANSMQLDASFNLFGVESVSLQEMNKFGNQNMSRNQTVGKRWIIQPKFETPMMNFANNGFHPIQTASSTLTLPAKTIALPNAGWGTGSVPRGMWHQFGVIEPDPAKGIFVEIEDIPTNWLKNHYDVNLSASVYNNEDPHIEGQKLYKKMKSLVDLMGFEKEESSMRLGELAESRTLKEAIVAIPYIVTSIDRPTRLGTSTTWAATQKKFIEISEERYNSARAAVRGSMTGDSLDAAGESIRLLLQKMDRYVLPPQFDFINNDSVTPIVMYMFEFEYKLDKDDLSYIWQNLAPRHYKKMEFQVQSTAHALLNTELLEEDNIMDNESLRWMVFKVKQKAPNRLF